MRAGKIEISNSASYIYLYSLSNLFLQVEAHKYYSFICRASFMSASFAACLVVVVYFLCFCCCCHLLGTVYATPPTATHHPRYSACSAHFPPFGFRIFLRAFAGRLLLDPAAFCAWVRMSDIFFIFFSFLCAS